MTKRLSLDHCAGILIDVQEFFLAQLDAAERERIETATSVFAGLFAHLQIPTLVTLEKPVAKKGVPPTSIAKHATGFAALEKNFFDLTRESEIKSHLASLKRSQMVITGCETDVCVLQSCLGLIDLGYEVYVVEDLLFSSSKDVGSAVERMKSSGATFVSMKTLYFELMAATAESPHRQKIVDSFGPIPLEIARLF